MKRTCKVCKKNTYWEVCPECYLDETYKKFDKVDGSSLLLPSGSDQGSEMIANTPPDSLPYGGGLSSLTKKAYQDMWEQQMEMIRRLQGGPPKPTCASCRSGVSWHGANRPLPFGRGPLEPRLCEHLFAEADAARLT